MPQGQVTDIQYKIKLNKCFSTMGTGVRLA